jgi:hypothetical protein
MRKRTLNASIGAALLLVSAAAGAVQINFTGGTVHLLDGTTQTTNNSVVWQNVDYYEEGGFRLDFEPDTATGFSTIIGNYYGGANDVIHSHWSTGDFGGVTRIIVTKIDGTAFDLNYFVLTSNTDTGGSVASGLEQARIHASTDGTTSSHSQLLPPENWGFPATQIFLGSQFDAVKAFWFTVDNAVDCFGMDNFFIDEPAPGVPVPGTAALMALGMLGMMACRRRVKI